MPGLRKTSVPAADRLHPWIHQQTFYTLPVGLWKAVIKELGSSRFKSDDIALGWLLTNPLFLNEHDRLWEGASEELIGASIPRRIEARRSGHELPAGWQRQPDSASGVAAQFREFCLRWRLSQLAGPYLPVPVEPRIPNLLASQQAAPQFQIPDIIAINGGGLVREMITDSLRQPRAEHLAEWMQIVEPDNQGRKTIHRFARLFELQHYSRALAQRHPNALAGEKEKLRLAFAKFFSASDDTIRSDLHLLKKRLGRDHYQAGGEMVRRIGPIAVAVLDQAPRQQTTRHDDLLLPSRRVRGDGRALQSQSGTGVASRCDRGTRMHGTANQRTRRTAVD